MTKALNFIDYIEQHYSRGPADMDADRLRQEISHFCFNWQRFSYDSLDLARLNTLKAFAMKEFLCSIILCSDLTQRGEVTRATFMLHETGELIDATTATISIDVKQEIEQNGFFVAPPWSISNSELDLWKAIMFDFKILPALPFQFMPKEDWKPLW